MKTRHVGPRSLCPAHYVPLLCLCAMALLLAVTAGCGSSSEAAGAGVATSAEPGTWLYVQTEPVGAQVRLAAATGGASRSQGPSPQLIPVPPGASSMTVEVELDGHARQQQEVKIEGGRITRVEFRFEGTAMAGQPAPLEGGHPPDTDTMVDGEIESPACEPFRRVHLPDADKKGAPVVLDLASGEMLAVPDEQGDLTMFTRLGKGDLAFDQLLICLRGATAMQRRGDELVAMPSEVVGRDAIAYKLEGLPTGRLLVTTAEKKEYEINILAVTEDGGIDLEFVPAHLGVLPVAGKIEYRRQVELDPEPVRSADVQAARVQVRMLEGVLKLFRLDMGRYPSNEEGIGVLSQRQPPSDALGDGQWRGPYMDGVPLDPWGNPYIYRAPEERNPDSFDLFSKGPDGIEGTDDDIGNKPSPAGDGRQEDNSFAPPAANVPPKFLTMADNGKTITLPVGGWFIVSFPEGSVSSSNTFTHTWKVAEITGKAVEPLGDPSVAFPDDPSDAFPIRSRDGKLLCRFKAVAPGTSTLKLQYSRRSAQNAPPEKTFSITIEVRAEQTVSDVIADFIQAAVEGDDDTVAALYPAQAHNAEEGIEEMRQIVSSGMKPGELERTIVRGDRALAISRPGRPEGPSTRLLCLVYTLERRGDGWLITDIDMEEEESVPGEVRRFKED